MRTIAVVGATGAVGQEILDILAERSFEAERVRLFASDRAPGRTLPVYGVDVPVESLTYDSFKDVNIAFFSAGAEVSRNFVPHAVASGCYVIDNSSAYRHDREVPLVVPPVNGHVLERLDGMVIANPNCTTAIIATALGPLHRRFGLRIVEMVSFQAVSGAGRIGMAELEEQIGEEALDAPRRTPRAFPARIVSNVIPCIGTVLRDGYTSEERKFHFETGKILGISGLHASATCVRVPVMRSHSAAVTAHFEKDISPDAARECLSAAPGIIVVDDPGAGKFPMPIDATGRDECLVGRIRNGGPYGSRSISFFISGDQLRRGAALNAVEIAEVLVCSR